MQIHHQEIADVRKYITTHRHMKLEDKELAFQNYLRLARQFKTVDESTVMLEVGTGTGWFPILCKARGLNCKGLEISPQLIEYAKDFGSRYGVDPDIELGNLEDSDIGENRYEVIFAMSVFEHVEHWEVGLRKVYRALKPGGIMVFESTNKFSPTSGEFHFPLYGWLPDRLRYRLRIARQGADVMHLGIDFNQFRYPMLRREFRRAGFREIYDRIHVIKSSHVASPLKKVVGRLIEMLPPVRHAVLAFMPTTNFVCVK